MVMSEGEQKKSPRKDPAWVAFFATSLATLFLQSGIVGASHWVAKLMTFVFNGGSLVYLLFTREQFPGVKFWQYKKPQKPKKDSDG